MARYTPALIASLRRDYEETDKPMRTIAAAHEISLRTLHRMAVRENWNRRADRPPKDLPTAMRLLNEAEALLAQTRARRTSQ
jgi:hypothetical protein